MVLPGSRLRAGGLQQGRGGADEEQSHLVHIKAVRAAEGSNWLSLWV